MKKIILVLTVGALAFSLMESQAQAGQGKHLKHHKHHHHHKHHKKI